MNIFKPIIFILLFGTLLSGSNVSERRNVSGGIQADFVPDYLSDTCFAGSQDFFSIASVEAFYSKRKYRTAWSKNKRLSPLADSMIHIIRTADYLGLSPTDYHLSEMEALLQLLNNDKGDSFYLAQADKLLTNSFFTMAYHLEKGRINLSNFKAPEKPASADSIHIAILEKALAGNKLKKALEALEPAHPQYSMLKGTLKQRLDQSFEAMQEPEAEAIREKEIAVLSINLERWRQEVKLFPNKYLFINIPSFNLDVVEDNGVVLNSKVIVGKPATPTPLLNGVVECFIIYPYWTVPRSIATLEILPKIKKNIDFLKANYYQVLDSKGNILDPHTLDWDALSAKNFPYTIRQTEGEYNALGIVKFMFDNPYSVYLHDTNVRSLFQRENRALSHGCIRLEKYFELAHYLVKNDSIYQDPQVLQQLFETRRRRTVNLPEMINIYTRYYTVEMVNGSLNFYNDIYKRDEKLIRALYKNIYM